MQMFYKISVLKISQTLRKKPTSEPFTTCSLNLAVGERGTESNVYEERKKEIFQIQKPVVAINSVSKENQKI